MLLWNIRTHNTLAAPVECIKEYGVLGLLLELCLCFWHKVKHFSSGWTLPVSNPLVIFMDRVSRCS